MLIQQVSLYFRKNIFSSQEHRQVRSLMCGVNINNNVKQESRHTGEAVNLGQIHEVHSQWISGVHAGINRHRFT